MYYDYPGTNEDIDYTEFYVGTSYEFIDFKFWWTPNFFSIGKNARYLDLNLNFELPYDFSLVLHGGYTDGRALDPEFADLTGLSDYLDYSVALGYSLGPVDLEVKWLDTDLSGDFKVSNGALQNDSRVIFTVSTTLPWDTGGGEE